MKRYIKPSIDVIETDLTSDCLQIVSDTEGYKNEFFSVGHTQYGDVEDDEFSDGF